MKRKSQLELIPRQGFERVSFGGSHLIVKRKALRPLSLCKPIHLILKSNKRTLLSKKTSIEKTIHSLAVKNRLKLKDFEVHSNHIHFHLLIPKRASYVSFIRAVTSEISRLMKITKLWSQLPFTRILMSKREVLNLFCYFFKNRSEVEWLEMTDQGNQRNVHNNDGTS